MASSAQEQEGELVRCCSLNEENGEEGKGEEKKAKECMRSEGKEKLEENDEGGGVVIQIKKGEENASRGGPKEGEWQMVKG